MSNNIFTIPANILAEGQRVIIIDDVAYLAGIGGSGAPGAGVDLSVVTVGPDSMLSGKIAIDSTGTIVTGTIPTITSSDIQQSGATLTIPPGYSGDDGIVHEIQKATVTSGSNSITISPGYVEDEIYFSVSGGGGSDSPSGFKLTCSSDSSDVQRTTDGDYMYIAESELPEWLRSFRYPGTSVYKRAEFCSVLDSDLYLACSQDEGDYYWYIVSCGLDDDASPCGVITDLNSQTLTAGDFSMYSMLFDEDTSIAVEQIGGGGSGGYTKADVIKNVLIFG